MADVAHENASRIGVDPAEYIVVMENHDQALTVWRQAGVKRRILVHIDAHHDMWWVEDKGLVTIANFICPALKEDLVREVFWVVPDDSMDTPKNRSHILTHLKKIRKQYSGRGVVAAGWTTAPNAATLPAKPLAIDLTVMGKSLHVVRMASLPRFDEPVLLDIDVDYMMISHVTYGQTDAPGSVPWLWPEELVARLAEGQMRSDLCTVAYSVEGGYTPLKWKYLGDELALRLKQPVVDTPLIEGFRWLREGSEAAERGEHRAAEEKLQQAAVLSGSAAPRYHHACLLRKLGRAEEARKVYRLALETDATYRTAFNSAGFVHLRARRLREAEAELNGALALDPDDAYAHYGLAEVSARQQRWADAEGLLRKSLASDAKLIDSHRLLGKVLAKQGRFAEAIAAYERSIKLALTGHKPLSAPLLTATGNRRLMDPFISETQERLGNIYAKTGNIAAAIDVYRMSTGGGYDRFALRVRLAHLYVRQSRWRPGMAECWQALKMILPEIAGSVRKYCLRSVRWLSRRSAGEGA